MKFPKQELNVGAYFNQIKALLNDTDCHIFIDTNIIIQLYRLNEDARKDFYTWVDSCNERFHIPCWAVHEYSNQVTTKKTKGYLPELAKAKIISTELANISNFIKEYVGDSLLIGSDYVGRKETLFSDIDVLASKFNEISTAINTNLVNHQQIVHQEIIDNLTPYVLDSNIYDIIRNLSCESDLRFDSNVPPGYKDADKDVNRNGDLIIWKEIIDFCKNRNSEKVKAIFISKDSKADMVYCPLKQSRGVNPNLNERDKIAIAQESLVYEFKLATGSEDFYSLGFYPLVQILSSRYEALALSFQVATEQENRPILDETLSCVEDEEIINDRDSVQSGTTEESTDESEEHEMPAITDNSRVSAKYSTSALADSDYDITEGHPLVSECIEKLKSYNWYVQNPAISKLMNSSLSIKKISNTQQNRDSFFVLGRNILQSADGTSGSAIYFIRNIQLNLTNWPKTFKEAFIDGCLYEVFFDSMGQIRQKAFKASYFGEVVEQVYKLDKPYSFDFINEQLQQKEEERFVPEVNSNKKYKFEFEFYEKDESNIFNEIKTKWLKINDRDVSETFISDYMASFSDVESLKQNLSTHYAIPVNDIELKPLPDEVKYIYFIDEDKYRDYISF